MTQMINFAVDLGTTNSLIAKFNRGTVDVFKNPIGFKETLPSVVGFRNDRILVGDKARDYMEKDPKSVVGRFKRTMGTTESYRIQSLSQSKTPVELSAFVLKELKTFIHTGESPDATVITVPASFDMVQCKGTTEAGCLAGFKQVILLQEPIAASLAYANKEKNLDLKNSQWIVYDLGGGTFDVALVRIVEGELRVMDHEGDNFLGGIDFDAMIVEQIIAPRLEATRRFHDLVPQMKSDSGRYNTLWYLLLHSAEEAKIELSTRTSTEIDIGRVNLVDESNKPFDECLAITRSDFENLIRPLIDRTAEMLGRILTRNSLQPSDLRFVLMVGGSTYIPFVRRRIEELLQIPVNTGIDPTNAIVVGAAYYAGTKEVGLNSSPVPGAVATPGLKIRAVYNRASQEKEEMFSAKVEGSTAGLNYRITRSDGAFDSGLKPLAARIHEDLPLQEEAYNFFEFQVYDSQGRVVSTELDSIQIAHGQYSVAGQLLPHDLSLVVDDVDQQDTKLESIFERNTVLPAKRRRMTKEASRALRRGTDDQIRIMVVEGPADNHFSANTPLGYLSISAKDVTRDIPRGADIELEFEVSESRDLTVRVSIPFTGQSYSDVFRLEPHNIPAQALSDEIQLLASRLEREKVEALESERYEVAKGLDLLEAPLRELEAEALQLADDNVNKDGVYKLAGEKRRIAERFSRLTAGKRIDGLRAEYSSVRDEAVSIVGERGNDYERSQLNEVIAQEHTLLVSNSPARLEAAIAQLHRITFQILRRTPEFLISWFEHLVSKRESLNDQVQAKNLIDAGKRHIAAEDFDRLVEVNSRLHSLLPEREQATKEMQHFTGIV